MANSTKTTPLIGNQQIQFTSLTEDTSPDETADFVLTNDASAGTTKKVKLQNLNYTRRFKVQSAGDVTNNTATYAPLTELTVPVLANANYRIVWYLPALSVSVTTGIETIVTASAGTLNGITTNDSSSTSRLPSTSSIAEVVQGVAFGTPATHLNIFSTTVPSLLIREVFLSCTSDATVTISFRTEGGGVGSLNTIKQYACVEYEALGREDVI
jgi:hypothetical protein